MRWLPRRDDEDLINFVRMMLGFFLVFAGFGLLAWATTPSESSLRDYKLKKLPPATRLIDEKSADWWVVEIDGRQFLAHYGSSEFFLTPMTDRKVVK